MFTLHNGDCLQVMPSIPSGSIDAIITDLPYGTTACAWDEVIPFAPMWKEVKRVLKPRGCFVTTSSQPFASALVMSNPEMFKYEWIWDKHSKGNFMQANFQPLKTHENIMVFSEYPATFAKGKPTAIYYAQKVAGYIRKAAETVYPNSWRDRTKSTYKVGHKGSDSRYPTSIIDISNASHVGKTHPTQKNVSLYEYLIRTYTNEGETVLDIAMGSGTTIEAAERTGRNSIGIEKDEGIFQSAVLRLKPFTPSNNRMHLTAFGDESSAVIPLQSNLFAEVPAAKHGGK